jgi:hypothetical protein
MELATTLDPGAEYITEIGGRHYMVDEPANRISFLDNRFYKCSDGSFVPSVTTILDAYPKGAAYTEWLKRHGEDSDLIRDEAGRRGSIVHGLTEDFDNGAEISLMDPQGGPRYKMLEWSMLERYVDFRKRHPATIHAIELNMASKDCGYAGTLDRVMTIDGTTYLLDIKTSGAIYDSYWMQQAAYHELLHRTGLIARLFPDGPVPEIKLAILWLNANTKTYRDGMVQGPGWQLKVQDEPTTDLLDMFECVRHTWIKVNKNATPKTTSYNLSHKL